MRTPLMEACWRGDIEEARQLIKDGADVNARNKNGTTPLMYAKTYAFSTGNITLIELLLKNGADIDARDNAGKTAADYTIERCALILKALSGPHDES
ncbi:ankyrin repeat domain-containing protein [Pseudomonas mosselii]|uniref:ankyrin repeat domain-containing protein n=1 Tax=Pseudomonas mosselii TaxID=78327 RepID=UPI00244C6DBB|nr:ankyrin repeat domain-containing protein [Pseudomonas mosselii]MDH1657963.1 ankyrin repeat domain-containing protein [Pseudomonas mosselii]MDH1714893.1 ankyrin repeat domain-containing protein [Pseudomonas mosselii]MDH1721638.1 ankyrin repeat domain-containing protein [Pseudomonas mosselii]